MLSNAHPGLTTLTEDYFTRVATNVVISRVLRLEMLTTQQLLLILSKMLSDRMLANADRGLAIITDA